MVYVFLANGFETVEALACVDILRRAEIETVTVGVNYPEITSSQSIPVRCDEIDSKIGLYDDIEAIILPGGMPGTVNLEESQIVRDFIDFAVKKDILIGAICAAPSILGKMGLLAGKRATCFPGFEKYLEGAEYTGNSVETDGKIITGKGMGVAVDFALEIVAALRGRELADRINKAIQSK
jgi:4-methyl-5(b-hydroxyethyl)-thiazole monophosphate biosynthesis